MTRRHLKPNAHLRLDAGYVKRNLRQKDQKSCALLLILRDVECFGCSAALYNLLSVFGVAREGSPLRERVSTFPGSLLSASNRAPPTIFVTHRAAFQL